MLISQITSSSSHITVNASAAIVADYRVIWWIVLGYGDDFKVKRKRVGIFTSKRE
jgi:hypothetical protein